MPKYSKKLFKFITNQNLCNENFTPPEISGLPKIHKLKDSDYENGKLKDLVEIALRPIVAAYATIFTNLSILFNNYLQGFIESKECIIKRINHLIKEIEEKKIPKDHKWVIMTADVVALYPNVNHEELLLNMSEIMTEIRNKSNIDMPLTDESIINLIEFTLKNTLINHTDDTFMQILGLIMGNNMAHH